MAVFTTAADVLIVSIIWCLAVMCDVMIGWCRRSLWWCCSFFAAELASCSSLKTAALRFLAAGQAAQPLSQTCVGTGVACGVCMYCCWCSFAGSGVWCEHQNFERPYFAKKKWKEGKNPPLGAGPNGPNPWSLCFSVRSKVFSNHTVSSV